MKVKRTLALILVLCLSLGVLSGCGGSTDTPESTAPEEEAESKLDLGEIPDLTFPEGFPNTELTSSSTASPAAAVPSASPRSSPATPTATP